MLKDREGHNELQEKTISSTGIHGNHVHHLIRALSLFLGWFFLVVFFFAIQRNTYSYIWYFTTGIPFLIVVWLWTRKSIIFFIEGLDEKRFVVLCITAFIMTRIVWLISVRSIPHADFATFDFLASLLSRYEPINQPLPRQVLVPAGGYPLFLGVWYSLVGHSLFTGKLFNLLLGAASVPLIYKLAGQISTPLVARITAILFVLWPTQIMMSGVLASEHLAVFLALVAFYFLLKEAANHRLRNVVFCAVFLGLAFIVRYALISALAASIFFLVLSGSTSKILKLKIVSGLTASFLAVYALYLLAMTMVYHITPLSQGMFNLLVGTNVSAAGHWNKEDAEKYFSYPTFVQANEYARQEVFQRITSNPKEALKLMAYKSVLTWADGTYGYYCSTLKLADNRLTSRIVSHEGFLGGVSQYFHLLIILLSAIGCLKLFYDRDILKYSPILLLVLSGTGLHSILETQGRYSYVMFIFLLIIAAKGICSLNSANPSTHNSFQPYEGY